MSIFAQVSSTPESMYEEIMDESSIEPKEGTDDWYLSIFFKSLKYAIRNKNKLVKRTNEELVTYIIGTWVYHERDRNCIRGNITGGVKRFRMNFKGCLWDYLDIPYDLEYSFYKGSYTEREEARNRRDTLCEAIRKAYCRRYGKDYDYDKVIKDYRVQEALKFYV